MSKRVQLNTILKAIKKNGYPKAKRLYASNGEYCSLGQAAKNMGYYDEGKIGRSLGYDNGQFGKDVFYYIADLNDNTDLSVPEIADMAFEKFQTDLKRMIVLDS